MPQFTFSNGVLLARAVEVLLPLATEGIINYSPEELSLVVHEPSGLCKAALRINLVQFPLINCYVNGSVLVNLEVLYMQLNRSTDEETLTINVGDGGFIFFHFHNNSTGDNFYSLMIATRIYDQNRNINESQYFYEVSVRVPSQEFRNLIRHLRQFGSTVNMTVKRTHVTFRVRGVETALSTWNNQCHISGVAEGNILHSMFSLKHMRSLWRASLIQPRHVCICCSNTFNCMLHYRVGEGISIKFYFL